jgi:hypothetical protein
VEGEGERRKKREEGRGRKQEEEGRGKKKGRLTKGFVPRI